MGQKIHPKSFRLGIIENWESRWLSLKNYKQYLEEDEAIRSIIRTKLRQAGVASVVIERSGQNIRVKIKTSRPGLVIGRSGKGVEDLRSDFEKAIRAIRKHRKAEPTFSLNIDVEEVSRTEISAAVIAQDIAGDLERRRRFRRVVKQTLDKVSQHRGVKGAKIRVSGRLDGKEIARTEWLSKGSVPLHTLRANIDYGEATAFCSYGAVGIKVWIYKGEVFEVSE